MKILFLSREYPPETGGGGIGSYVASVAPALVARGHEVHVLSCVPGQTKRDYADSDVWIHRRGVVRVRGLGRLTGSPSAAIRFTTALSCYLESRRLHVAFDVVEAPDWMAEGLVFGLVRSHALIVHIHTPLVLVERYSGRRFTWNTRLGSLLERLAVSRSNQVVAPSHMVIRILAGMKWFEEKEAMEIPLPVEEDYWADVCPVESTQRIVLCVGRLEHRKAPEILIRAASELVSELGGIEIVFVGRTNGIREAMPYGEWLAQLAGGLGVSCRFVDQVPRAELAEWYGRARVVALPSVFDNFPMAGLEAMAAGRPLVCSSACGTSELIRGSQAGRIVPPGDPVALAKALKPYLLSAEHAAEAGRKAREIVRAECDARAVAARREACYKEAHALWRRSSRHFRKSALSAEAGQHGQRGRDSRSPYAS